MTETTNTTTKSAGLTALDRCDRCSAAARVRYDLNGFDLQFCGHHDRENRPALLDHGAELVEDLDLLEEAASDMEQYQERQK